jgi:hypothetical protein
MITTVTTATSAVSSQVVGSALVWGVVVVFAMILLLVSKELASASEHPKARTFIRISNVGVVPLGFALLGIVAARILGLLA